LEKKASQFQFSAAAPCVVHLQSAAPPFQLHSGSWGFASGRGRKGGLPSPETGGRGSSTGPHPATDNDRETTIRFRFGIPLGTSHRQLCSTSSSWPRAGRALFARWIPDGETWREGSLFRRPLFVLPPAPGVVSTSFRCGAKGAPMSYYSQALHLKKVYYALAWALTAESPARYHLRSPPCQPSVRELISPEEAVDLFLS
jgi:hypothetical protein